MARRRQMVLVAAAAAGCGLWGLAIPADESATGAPAAAAAPVAGLMGG